MADKFKATWVSFSSISDYIKCPRAYYLKNIYKNPSTGKKIEIIKPALALGSAVHNVLEPLAKIDPKKRFDTDLIQTFDKEFLKYSGKKGGFTSDEEYEENRQKGHKMLENVIKNSHILKDKTYISDQDLLNDWLSKDNNIVICGKIDWINIDEENDSFTVIDFKTSKEEEKNDLQLQIYALLLYMLNKKAVNKLYYWYININEELTQTNLPNLKESYNRVLEIALQISEARRTNHFECKKKGCYACRDYEKVLAGFAEQVGIGGFGREIYITD